MTLKILYRVAGTIGDGGLEVEDADHEMIHFSYRAQREQVMEFLDEFPESDFLIGVLR